MLTHLRTSPYGSGRRKGLVLSRQSTSKQNEYLDSKQCSGHKYDDATGQIFTETTAKILSSRDRAWSRRTVVVYERNDAQETLQLQAAKAWEARRLGTTLNPMPSALDESSQINKKGPRSLQNVALEQVIQNISDLSMDSFEYLPVTLVKRIWDIARQRCTISFETWVLFSKILYHEDYISEDLLQYAEAFSSPKLSLEMYIKPLKSKSFDFITSICITAPFPVPDLIRLASVRNLGSLEIINTDTHLEGYLQMGVSDRLIRGWHDAAIQDGAFPVLRILRLWNHDEVTTRSLAYLNGFPSLAVYDVRGCNFNHRTKSAASDLGWKLSTETDILKILKRICSKRAEVLRKQLVHTSPGTLQDFSLEVTREDIRRIPKHKADIFLATRPSEQEGESPQLLLRAEPAFPRRAQVKAVKSIHRQNDYFLQRSQKLDAWEASVYKAYARIGELRSETDLERVGIIVPEFVVQEDELLNPVPMVLVRLGKSVSSLMLTKNVNTMAFIRIQAPSEEVPHSDYQPSSVTSSQSQKTLQTPLRSTESNSQPADGGPKSLKGSLPPSLQKNKKRRLGDVLGSFS